MAQRDAEARLREAQAASQVEAREALRASEDRLRADQVEQIVRQMIPASSLFCYYFLSVIIAGILTAFF